MSDANAAAVVRLAWPELVEAQLVALPGELRAEYGVPTPRGVTDLVISEGGVWVASASAQGIVRIDPATGDILQVIKAPGVALARHGDGVLLVGAGEGVVRQLLPGDTAAREIGAVGEVRDVVAAFGAIWVLDNVDGAAVRLDARTGREVARLPLVKGEPPYGIRTRLDGCALPRGTLTDVLPGLMVTGDRLWAGSVVWPEAGAIDSRFGQVEMVQIDPLLAERVGEVRLDFAPAAYAAANDRILLARPPGYRDGKPVSALVLLDGITGETVAEAALDAWGLSSLTSDGSGGWLGAGRGQLVRIDGESLESRQIEFERPDTARWAPRFPSVPERVAPGDPSEFEEWERARMEHSTVGSADQRVTARPRLSGIQDGNTGRWAGLTLSSTGPRDTYEAVRLRGEFPDTQVEVIFRSSLSPECRFGWTYAVWDAEASRREQRPVDDVEYLSLVDVYLLEDTGTRMPEACDPDREGITWLGAQPVTPAEAAGRVPFPVFVPVNAPSGRVECVYQRRIGSGQLGVSIQYHGPDDELVLALHQWSRWPPWIGEGSWRDATYAGQPVQILDATKPHGWGGALAVRRRCGRTHVAAGPGSGEEILAAIGNLRAVEPAPGSRTGRPEVAYHLALEYEQLGDADKAAAAFREAGEADHHRISGRAWFRLARLATRRDDHSSAEDADRRAAYAADRWTAARAGVHLGVALMRRGDHDAARRELKRVRELDDPDHAALATINLAILAGTEGDSAIAARLLGEVVNAELPDRSIHAAYLLGLAREQQGDLGGAAQALECALLSDHKIWAPKASAELDRLRRTAG